ncbi:MAG: hypothetical protein ABIW32_01565 [Terrimesophilobacter sp.]
MRKSPRDQQKTVVAIPIVILLAVEATARAPERGESVAYYSYPKLSVDDVQRVTILSFEYIEKTALPDGKHWNKMVNGVLVLSLR